MLRGLKSDKYLREVLVKVQAKMDANVHVYMSESVRDVYVIYYSVIF